MELVAILGMVDLIIEKAPDVLGVVAGICGAVYGFWRNARARKWAETAAQTETILANLVTAVEMLPPDVAPKVKLAIDRLMRYSGKHGSEWVDLVKQIEKIVHDLGLGSKSGEMSALCSAADAVASARVK